MKRPVFLLLTLVLVLSGCGKRLSGRYEAEASIPRMPMPNGVDPKAQRQMDDAMSKLQDMTRQTLEFDGSTVRMGSKAAMMEYKYRIKGQTLEVLVDAMGQKATIPMTIETDGSITYLTLNYRKVQ